MMEDGDSRAVARHCVHEEARRLRHRRPRRPVRPVDAGDDQGTALQGVRHRLHARRPGRQSLLRPPIGAASQSSHSQDLVVML